MENAGSLMLPHSVESFMLVMIGINFNCKCLYGVNNVIFFYSYLNRLVQKGKVRMFSFLEGAVTLFFL